MKNYFCVILALIMFLLFNTSKINAATYATLPFTQSFDNSWISGAGVRDIPSPNWVNSPVYGNNAWSRDDDGFARGAWNSISGGYTPAGANTTAHSARFHSFDATNGTSGSLDLYIDFSSIPGAKCLSYYFINNDGNDSLEVFLSTNGGSSFTKINSKTISYGWSKVTVPLGFRGSATAIIRFKATSDYGTSDIGIDEIAVESASSDLPFIENFDNDWVDLKNTRDVPSKYWINTPATGNNSWSRDDDGVLRGAWNKISGSYFPAGANSSAHSARFHSFGAVNKSSGIIDLYLNLSSQAGIKYLSYNYINPDGNDSLEVFLSTDAGASFTKVNSQKISASWKTVTISLGSLSAVGNNGILRFKATSDFFNTDIGIDKVSVYGIISQANIISFSLPGQTTSSINSSTHTIDVDMPYGTSVSALIASFGLSSGATAKVGATNQVSGTTVNNFTSTVIYSVTAQDGVTIQNWTVNVTIGPNSQANITSFSLPGQIQSSITYATHTIDVEMPYGSSISALDATFGLSSGATAKVGSTNQVSGTTINNFASSVLYVVKAQDGVTTQNWTVNVTINVSSQANITSFSLPGLTNEYINSSAHTIEVFMPYGSSITALPATFSLSVGATAKVGLNSQISNTTTNNFTTPVIYTVTAQDGITSQNWVVSVTIAANTETSIVSYSLPGQIGNAMINTSFHSITVTMPYGTSVSSLAASFSLSAGATTKVGSINQLSGSTINNFTSSLTYVVIAHDGINTQDWSVIVSFSKSSQTNIISFSLPDQISATINDIASTIAVIMPNGVSLTSIAASFGLSAGATAKVGAEDQVSGSTVNNFTSPVSYVITAQNGATTQSWTVFVTTVQSNQTEIVSFYLPNQVENSTIDAVNHTIEIKMANGFSTASLIASFKLSAGAYAKVGAMEQISNTTKNNFTFPVTYNVTAQDGITTQKWKVVVTYSTAISNVNAKNNIDVYPNPSNGIFNLKFNTDNKLSFEVFDIRGRLIIRETVNTNTENGHVDLTDKPCGMYLLKINTAEGSSTVKLIKN